MDRPYKNIMVAILKGKIKRQIIILLYCFCYKAHTHGKCTYSGGSHNGTCGEITISIDDMMTGA